MTDASCCPSVLDSAAAGSQQVDLVRRGVAEIRRIIGVLVTAGIATVDGAVGADARVVGAEGLTVRTPVPWASTSTRAHLDTWRVTSPSGSGQALPLPALAERGPATWSRFASPGAPR